MILFAYLNGCMEVGKMAPYEHRLRWTSLQSYTHGHIEKHNADTHRAIRQRERERETEREREARGA